MKKITALLCLAALLSGLFAACGQAQNQTEPRSAGIESGDGAASSDPVPSAPSDEERKSRALTDLLSLSDAQLKEEVYGPALTLYLAFTGVSCPWTLDWNTDYQKDPSGPVYHPVSDGRLAGYDALLREAGQRFSRSFLRSLLEKEVLIEHEDRVYSLPPTDSANIYYLDHTLSLSLSAGSPVCTLTATFIKDSSLMSIEDYDNIPDEDLYTLTAALPLVWEGEGWVFDDFASAYSPETFS